MQANWVARDAVHYNYYRDYSPEIGRYIESDPVGLIAGTNTYSYVAGNPLSKLDPLGLKIWWNSSNSWTNVPSGSGWTPWNGWTGGQGSSAGNANCPTASSPSSSGPSIADPNGAVGDPSGDPNLVVAGAPGNNQAQNAQVRAVVRILGLTPAQRQQLHREISGQNYDFQEIVRIGQEIKAGQ